MNKYLIRGGVDGKKRLEVLSRTFWPTTSRLLREAGLGPGLTCLDLGCGGGDVTLELASAVGPQGRVIGIDADPVKLALAREAAAERGLANVEFRVADIDEWHDDSVYDLIYCRFVLTHLNDPARVVRQMHRAVRPGGTTVVEDLDFRGHFCYPASHAFEDYLRLYRAVATRRGGDADIGPKLYLLFVDEGWHEVHLSVASSAFVEGESKRLTLLTLINIADSLIAEQLATREELDTLIEELERFTNDPRTTLGMPRVFQVWGRRV